MRVNIYEVGSQYKVTDLKGLTIIRGIGSVIERWLKSSDVTEVQVTGIDHPISPEEVFQLFRVGFPRTESMPSVQFSPRSTVVNGRSID